MPSSPPKSGVGIDGKNKWMELLKKSLSKRTQLETQTEGDYDRRSHFSAVFFTFVPFVGASALGEFQPPCYYAGTCKPLQAHYTVSLSCLLQGPSGIGANY